MGRGYGRGKSPTRFTFTYEDLSQILGCSVEAARKRVQRGDFDPKRLISVLEYVRDKLKPRLDEGKNQPR